MEQAEYEKAIEEFEGELMMDLGLTDLPAGVYTLMMQNGDEISHQQFIITY